MEESIEKFFEALITDPTEQKILRLVEKNLPEEKIIEHLLNEGGDIHD